MPAPYRVRLESGQEFGPAPAELLVQWAREGRVPPTAQVIDQDGSATPALQHPVLAPLVAAPPTVAPPLPSIQPIPDSPVSGLIPYHNPPALIGYYTSVASLIPGLGLLLGPIAIVLGIVGFRSYRRDPRRKGAAHAWVAIILGSVTTLLYWGFIIAVIVAAANQRSTTRRTPPPPPPPPARSTTPA